MYTKLFFYKCYSLTPAPANNNLANKPALAKPALSGKQFIGNNAPVRLQRI